MGAVSEGPTRMDDRRIWIALLIFGSTVLSFAVNRFLSPTERPTLRSVNRIPDSTVWSFIQKQAAEHGLDPKFVYALAWAESSLNANAKNGRARGIMQVTEPTWYDMTDLPFEMAWDYQTNIGVALDYLVFCKGLLLRNDAYSLPLLAASYRYGPTEVRQKKYKINRLDRPENEIYRRIFDGEVHPVEPPI